MVFFFFIIKNTIINFILYIITKSKYGQVRNIFKLRVTRHVPWCRSSVNIILYPFVLRERIRVFHATPPLFLAILNIDSHEKNQKKIVTLDTS